MMRLANRHILVGVSGGIAAYKSAELIRRLRGDGAEVRVVMTTAATAFITPLTLQALSGHPVRSETLDPVAEAGMDHIALARWADAVLVAPASADFMARLAAGMADDLLATLCLATEAPLLLAPAMNRVMWAAPATTDNAALLRRRGVTLLGPAEGEQACGESGPGRMLEPGELHEQLCRALASGPLAGRRVLITAGPTREPIDPVRYISNRSSGKMGYALARAAAAAGAQVVLVSGPVALDTPMGVDRVVVSSAAEMAAAVAERDCDIFIGTAAVADYRVEQPAQAKIKKGAESLSLELVRNPDILATVAARDPAPFCVGFAAETDDLLANARGKLLNKRLDMVAANWVGAGASGGFEGDLNALHVVWRDGERELPLTAKDELARQLIALIVERLPA